MDIETIIADLKQFIAATVRQATADMATKDDIATLRYDMDQRFEKVDERFEKVDERFEKVDKRFEHVNQRFDDLELKLDTIADAQAESIDDHEKRITKLEQKTA